MKKKIFILVLTIVVSASLLASSARAQGVCGPNGGSCFDSSTTTCTGSVVPDGSCGTGQRCCNTTPRGDFDDPDDAINPVEAPTNATFDLLNPLQIAGGDTIDDDTPSEFAEQLSTPGGIITRVLVFIFPLAGLILFLMITWGGFEVLTGSGDSSKVTAGKQRLTAAIVGFLILFASYWMVQIMETVFGVVIF